MKTSKKVVFFGNERLATAINTEVLTLKKLVSSGYDVRAIVTKKNPSTSSRKPRELEIESAAKEHNIPLLTPNRLSEIKAVLGDFNVEVGVLVAYGKIVPLDIINLFPRGIVNLHPSLLPKGRGPTPIESVILNGEEETGVSIMQLGEQMDTGPVYAQRKLSLKGNETKQDLANSLLELGSNMMVDNLDKILSGELQAIAQDESLATYSSLITKQDGKVDWTKPAAQIEREVRAYAGWPKSRARIGQTEVILTATKVGENVDQAPGTLVKSSKELVVVCGEKSLVIQQLIPIGKSLMSGVAFLAGYSQK